MSNDVPQTRLQRELDRRMKILKLSGRELARQAGISEAAPKAILAGRSINPRADTLARIARVLGCTVRDLVGDLEPDAEEAPAAVPTTPVAEVDVVGSAGGGSNIETEHEIAQWQFPTDWLRGEMRGPLGQLRVITVEGDSMAPTIAPGDKVIVDLSRTTPSPPGIFAVWDGLALVVKRVEHIQGSDPPRIRIQSDNDRYAPYERTTSEIKVVGRIRGRWERL